MRAVIYSRVSTDEQTKHGYSLPSQVEACRKRAADLGAIIIEEFVDEGISGEVLNRPGLEAALDRIKDVKTHFFICLDPDRLARNLSHQLIITDKIDRTRAELVFVNVEFKKTPEGKLFYAMRGAFSEYEKEKIKERTQRGKHQKAKLGKMTHNPRIFGYTYDKSNSALNPVPEDIKILEMMFAWIVEEQISYNEVAARLNTMDIPSPRNSIWRKATVKRILQNPAYLGVIYLNRYNTEGRKHNKYRPDNEKVSVTIRPESEWLPVKIPAVIDQKVWVKAQEVMANAKRLKPGLTMGDYLLSGLIRCGECGSPFNGTRVMSKTGTKYLRYYRCTGRVNRNGCIMRHIKAEEIEGDVWDKVVEWVSNPTLLVEEINTQGKDNQSVSKELEALDRSIQAAGEEKERLLYLFQKGIVKAEDIENGLDDIQSRVNALKSRQLQIEKQLTRKDIAQSNILHMHKLSKETGNTLNSLAFEEKRRVIRMIIAEILVMADGSVDMAISTLENEQNQPGHSYDPQRVTTTP